MGSLLLRLLDHCAAVPGFFFCCLLGYPQQREVNSNKGQKAFSPSAFRPNFESEPRIPGTFWNVAPKIPLATAPSKCRNPEAQREAQKTGEGPGAP